MSQITKIAIGAAVLVLLIAGVLFAYNTLSDRVSPEITLAENTGSIPSPVLADESNGNTENPEQKKAGESGVTGEYHKISAEDAYKMMSETDSFILLDVRTEEEYNQTRIPGSVLIPDNEISSRALSELPDKNAIIFVYCRSGRRSAIAANELAVMGYTNVYDFGGILHWPYETEQ